MPAAVSLQVLEGGKKKILPGLNLAESEKISGEWREKYREA